MNLATLKKLERGFYALMIAAEKEKKTDSQANQLYSEYSKQWVHWNDVWKYAAIAAARRKDKGEELFTIFIPDRHSLRAMTFTPRLVVGQTFWRRGDASDPYRYQTPAEPHIDVKSGSHYDLAWYFRYYMNPNT